MVLRFYFWCIELLSIRLGLILYNWANMVVFVYVVNPIGERMGQGDCWSACSLCMHTICSTECSFDCRHIIHVCCSYPAFVCIINPLGEGIAKGMVGQPNLSACTPSARQNAHSTVDTSFRHAAPILPFAQPLIKSYVHWYSPSSYRTCWRIRPWHFTHMME